MFSRMLRFLSGDNGSLTKKELARETYRSKFSDYLPWVAYDEESNCYLNGDETFGFIWECSPLAFADESTETVMEGLFRIGAPEGSVLQFILCADDHIEPYLDLYSELKQRPVPLIEETSKRFCHFYREGKAGLGQLSGIPVRNFRLLVSLKIPLRKDATTKAHDLYTTVNEVLSGARLYPVPLRPPEFLDWLRRLLNESPSLKNDAYDDALPISRQIIRAETEVTKSPLKLQAGGKAFRCITPKVFPKEVRSFQTNQLFGGIWGVRSDMDQLKTPFLYALNIVFENLKSQLHAKCNLVLQQQAVGSFAPSLRRKQEEYVWAVDKIDRGIQFVRVMPIFWVWGKEGAVTDSIKRAKRTWESQGYIMQEDRGILPILFISALPMGLYTHGKNVQNIDRDFIVPVDVVPPIVPVQGDFAGAGKPVLLFVGRKGQIFGIDVFDEQAINNNIFVAASSGSGKSFFVNYLTYNYFAANALVRIIDIGGSYKKMTKMLGARYLDFSNGSNICLNPFTNVIDIENEASVIASIILQMVYSATDSQPIDSAETAITLIKAAVNWAFHQEGRDASIDTVSTYLSAFPKYSEDLDLECSDNEKCIENFKLLAQTLAFNLAEFTSAGTYGRWFNGRSNFDISKDEFVVLELEHLRPQKELFKVVTLQVINAVTRDLYLSDRSRPRLIVFDEAWQFLREGSHLQTVIEEGYRRARKYGGSFTVVTQSVLDLKSFGNVGEVIRANSAFTFYLASSDFEKAKEEKLLDSDDFTMKLLKSVQTNKPRYSEVFMETPFGKGVGRLVVDRFSYFVYTSDAREIAELESLVNTGLTYEAAIQKMVEKYRS